jgi:hypothetical protein
MVGGMNSAKNKGDAGEREAVEMFQTLAPDLVMVNARRKLGAGRRDDMGDLDVFNDVAVQVKCYTDIVRALRESVVGAHAQAQRSGTTWSIGLAPIPRARRDGIRWIVISYEWPSAPTVHLPSFGSSSLAIDYFLNKSNVIAVPNRDRVALVERKDKLLVILSPVTAWLDAYRAAVARVEKMAS